MLYSLLDIKKDKERLCKEHRILILGAGEAGKSTFIKQMKIIHAEGLGNNEEKMQQKPLIASNIMSAINTLINQMSFEQEDKFHDDTDLVNALSRHELL